MRLLRSIVPVLLLTVFAVSTAEAQNRAGFWISGGIGGGVNTAESLDGARLGGAAGYLRLGGTVSDKLLLGVEFNGWTRSNNGIGNIRSNTTFTALLYPSPVGSFFLKGGLGISMVRVSADIGSISVSGTEAGFGSTLGLGYDIAVGSVSLTPNMDLLFQTFGGGTSTTTNTLLLFTIGITGH